MGDPNTGEIYEGMLRNEGDVPLSKEQAEFLRTLKSKDRIKRLREISQGLREAESVPTREMPRYKCHKEVWALKIANIQPPEGLKPTVAELEAILGGHGGSEVTLNPDGAALAITGAMITPAEEGYAPFHVSAEYMRKHRPSVGGYFIRYKDGYESYSPEKAFVEGYTKL